MKKKLLTKIPWLPVSALIFYTCAFIFWKFGLIPAPTQIFVFLEGLYTSYGLIGLFLASFLEGIVYLGLYFPGSFIIALAVFLSDGRLISFVLISLMVALAITITSSINYLLGRYFINRSERTNKFKGKSSNFKSFIFSMLHPNALAFYFFSVGINKRSPIKIILVPFIMFLYGLLWSSVLYLLKSPLKSAVESPYIMISAILTWAIIATFINYRKSKLLTRMEQLE